VAATAHSPSLASCGSAASEWVLAFDLGQDRYRVDSAPWFVRDLAVGDVVIVRVPGPGVQPVFERIEFLSDRVRSGSSAPLGPLEGPLEPVDEAFVALGVWAESWHGPWPASEAVLSGSVLAVGEAGVSDGSVKPSG